MYPIVTLHVVVSTQMYMMDRSTQQPTQVDCSNSLKVNNTDPI